jgi:hypothetical protein
MGERIRPRGVVDLRGGGPGTAGAGAATRAATGSGTGTGTVSAIDGTEAGDEAGSSRGIRLVYPAGAVVVVSGLPGSGKSTLLRRLAASGTGVRVVDPRTTHLRWESRMPAWLPYAVYRPLARLDHLARLCSAVRAGAPLLVHDCGSRAWLRRLLAFAVRHRPARTSEDGRDGRRGGDDGQGGRDGGVHLVLLDLAPAEALRGRRARGRHVPRRAFAAHVRGLGQLVSAIGARGRGAVPEAASVVLLDRVTRGLPSAVVFGPEPTAVARTDPEQA